MFDSRAAIEIRIPGGKSCVVRFPADAEWCKRSRDNRIVREIVSGGRSRRKFPDQERTAGELLAAIRKDTGERWDDEEALIAIAKLERAEVEDSREEFETVRISLRVMGGLITEHVLAVPSAKAVKRAGDRAYDRIEAKRQVITRESIEPWGELYDSLIKSTTGYADGVAAPIVHKNAAITELLDVFNSMTDGDSPE